MQVKKQQLEPDMKQWTGSKLGKEYVKAMYCHPAYLSYMQSTSCKMLVEAQPGIKIARRNINNLRYAVDTTLMAESEEELKSLLMKMKEESEKADLKLNIKKQRSYNNHCLIQLTFVKIYSQILQFIFPPFLLISFFFCPKDSFLNFL